VGSIHTRVFCRGRFGGLPCPAEAVLRVGGLGSGGFDGRGLFGVWCSDLAMGGCVRGDGGVWRWVAWRGGGGGGSGGWGVREVEGLC